MSRGALSQNLILLIFKSSVCVCALNKHLSRHPGGLSLFICGTTTGKNETSGTPRVFLGLRVLDLPLEFFI